MTRVLEWRDKNGKTPKMLAEGRKHRELLRFFAHLENKKLSFSGMNLAFDWKLVPYTIKIVFKVPVCKIV